MSRYDALAQALSEAPEPARSIAIASELGDQAARIDAVLRRVERIEAALEARARVAGA